MRLEAVKIESIPVRMEYGKLKQELINLVNEFIKSEYEAAEIKEYTGKSAKSLVAVAKKGNSGREHNQRENRIERQ